MPALTFITVCKGRLAHLQQTLPRLLAQKGDLEIVVVDYDCPQHTAAWLAEQHPEVRVVKVENEPSLSLARARNLGARVARSPWLMFVDADIFLAPDFFGQIAPMLAPNRHLRPAPASADAWGSFLVPRDIFSSVDGYDEVLRGWGGEDDDIYYRLETFASCASATFPAHLLSSIGHSDAERMQFHDVSDRWVSQRANACYLHIKYDLMRIAGWRPLQFALRASVYENVRHTVLSDAAKGLRRSCISITLPDELSVPMRGWTVHRRWVFDLEALPQPEASPNPALST